MDIISNNFVPYIQTLHQIVTISSEKLNVINSTEIKLKFNRKDFEDIYCGQNLRGHFNRVTTKKNFQLLLIAGVTFSSFLVYSLIKKSAYGMTFIIGAVFMSFFSLYIIEVFKISESRKKVKTYLDEVEKIKNHKIILTENKFELIQENDSTFEHWYSFIYYEIQEKYIYLKSEKEHFLIPKNSMSQDEFKLLSSTIQNKCKSKSI